ncbi:MAG: FHA domain-containing protein, partial [Halobacteriales archaeon]|nr:FHA domain-containing protein [Halobacteriales archaeon]
GGTAAGDDVRPNAVPDRLEPAVDSDDLASIEPTRIQRTYEELVLDVLGREIRVREGTTVGSEIRRAMVEAGESRDDALYIHRKHVRIDFNDGTFFLTRLGENSLEVNGRPVEKGDRVRIGDGDEVTFSGIVTARVRID